MSTGQSFSGLKVVDLASLNAGPAATTVLSDFGANVIKVEPPGFGDPYRILYRTPPNPVSDVDYAWQLTNRNKRRIYIATPALHEPGRKRMTVRAHMDSG
jgi:crotonobetainyl-CoA:carnitine CoA-transferase CaiB-like acyl-CoA transferase